MIFANVESSDWTLDREELIRHERSLWRKFCDLVARFIAWQA